MSSDLDETLDTEHFDVIIVGAGISGIGAAYELQKECPKKSYVILDALDNFGGTWLWHKYPGIRSDSDLFTFGYSFKPWLGAPIANADEILRYLGDVIDEHDLARHIRYGQRVTHAAWSSAKANWVIEVEQAEGRRRYSCSFLWMCQGFYRHAKGYTPQWPNMDDFKGPIVHPQTWPDDLDYSGKNIIVIGSGATAATVVPAMAKNCNHVTMLQRSPTYFFPRQNRNRLAEMLRDLNIDERWIHEIVRRKIIADDHKFLSQSMEDPETVKAKLLEGLTPYLSEEEIREHFTPRYRPWQQRIAVIPESDLLEALRDGKASVVTDEIEKFTANGIMTKSGKELPADIIVTATGFNLCVLGDVKFAVDGRAIEASETVTYRGMMFTGLPNMAWIFGYFRAASWTLRVELVASFVCRLLNHMSSRGAAKVEVALRSDDVGMEILPWSDKELFNPGYLVRDIHLLPKRGSKREWAHSQDYFWEKEVLHEVDLDDPAFVYSSISDTSAAQQTR